MSNADSNFHLGVASIAFRFDSILPVRWHFHNKYFGFYDKKNPSHFYVFLSVNLVSFIRLEK